MKNYRWVKPKPGVIVVFPGEDYSVLPPDWVKVPWPGPAGYWARRNREGVIDTRQAAPAVEKTKGGK